MSILTKVRVDMPDNVLEVAEYVASVLGPQTYLVGGSVRDAVLGVPCKDFDFCTPLTPGEVEDRIKARPSDELMARAQAIILEQAERELFSMFALPAEALQMTSDRVGSYVTAQAMREQIERMRGLRAREKTAPFDGLSHDEAMKRLLDVAAG